MSPFYDYQYSTVISDINIANVFFFYLFFIMIMEFIWILFNLSYSVTKNVFL